METKNLCAQIPLDLHAKVCQGKEQSTHQTLGQYVTEILTAYYENYEKGEMSMSTTKTLAFQIPEELFQRIKTHLERESARLGKKLSQRDFVLGLIQRELDEAEARQAAPADLSEGEDMEHQAG